MRRFERSKPWIVAAGIATLCAGARPSASQELTSTADMRRDVSLTVYGSDLCLVRELREIETRDGMFRLRYQDVTSGIQPATVAVRATGRRGVRVVEQSYEYDLISKSQLMEKYVGRQVGYRMKDGSRGTATLLSTHEGYVYELGGQIVFELPGDVVLDALPAGLSPRPTLVWTLDGARAGRQEIEVGYLSGGFGWQADYVLALDVGESKAQLTGWITLDNRSGATFENAQVKLVAGDVNRVREMMQQRFRTAGFAAEAATSFDEQASFEYYTYTLERRTNLKNNESKQIRFFDATDVQVRKSYHLRGTQVRLSPQFKMQSIPERVSVMVRLQNSKANNLGAPIPGGIVRVYKDGAEGAREFLGESRVGHTPRDEHLELEVGRAFDVVGEHVQTDYRRGADRSYEVAFDVKLRNHKETDIEVVVEEEFMGDWKILTNSLPYEKTTATTATFKVPVAAGGETVLTYRATIQP